MMFSGKDDGSMSDGVGLAVAPEAWRALRTWHVVSFRLLTVEFLTQMGPLVVVVAYAPTENSGNDEKDSFYEELEEVMRSINGLLMVIGDFSVRIGRQLNGNGVVGPWGLAIESSDNVERLTAFAGANGMCITNTLFPHKKIHQATWYPPNARSQPTMKDYILVRQKVTVISTRHKGLSWRRHQQ